MSFAVSLLLGALLGAVNAMAAVWTARRATALGPDSALRLVLAGMAIRMVLVLTVFALMLALAPVHRGAFVLGLGALFLAGMIAEVALVLSSSRSTPADA